MKLAGQTAAALLDGGALLRIRESLTEARLRVLGSAGPPPGLGGGPFLSVVCRLPGEPTAWVCERVQEALAGTGSRIYPPSTVHLTILDLTGVGRQRANRAVAAWAARQPPLVLSMDRIGYSRASAYVVLRGIPSVMRARAALARSAGRTSAVRPWDVCGVVLANVACFTAPLRSREAERLRQITPPVSAFRLEAAELVSTDKLLSDAATQQLARVVLGAVQT
jgi:hypothetical protein